MARDSFQFGGMDLVRPLNRIVQAAAAAAVNVRAYLRKTVTLRNWLSGEIISTPYSSQIQTIHRLNDTTPQGPVDGYSVISSDVQGNVFSKAVRVASGLSGNPVTIVPFRPNSSVQPWAYVSDSKQIVSIYTKYALNDSSATFNCSGQMKIRSDGLIYKTGIKEPPTAPIVGINIDSTATWITLPSTTPPWTNIGGSNPNYNYSGLDAEPPYPTIIATPVAGSSIVLAVTGTATVNGATHAPGDAGPSSSGYPGNFITTPKIVVFAFADANGSIIAQSTAVGAPPVVGNVGSGVTLTVPQGAMQLQLGINSHGGSFSANSGEYLVEATLSTASLPQNTAIVGTVTCYYWGDSPHVGPVASYIWKNPNDPGGSSQYNREPNTGPTNGAGFGSNTNNSLIVDASPSTGTTALAPAWTTLNSSGGVVGTVPIFNSGIEPPSDNLPATYFADFNCCFVGSIFFPEPGEYAVKIVNLNQIMFGIGGGVTSTFSPLTGVLGQTETVALGLPLLCVSQASGGGTTATSNFTISVPAQGTYQIEVDWDYWDKAGRTMVVEIAPHPGDAAATIPPLPFGVRQSISYAYKYRNSQTGALSNPSPASPVQSTPVLANTVASAYSDDPQVDKVDYYRQDSALANYTYVGTGPNDNGQGSNVNTAIVDTLSDTAAAGNQIMQYDDFEPVPSIDTPKSGKVTIVGGVVKWKSGDFFDTRWLPGTVILIGYPTQQAYTLVTRPTSTTTLIIPNIADGIGDAYGGGIPYNIAEPLLANQSLPYSFGPTDNINFAFQVGDPLRPGTLYWSKGSNLDSWPDTNQMDVTDPSEPLINGAMSGGLGVLFSNKRAWIIVPNFFNALATVTGTQGSTWTLQATSVNRGLFIPRCVAVEGGGAIFFRVDDGIHVTQNGMASQSITDSELYPLFSHEGSTPRPVTRNGVAVYPPDDSQPQAQKFAIQNGYLYYDYIALGQDGKVCTLVFDIAGGWVWDTYSVGVTAHAPNEGESTQGIWVGCQDGSLRQMISVDSTGGETPSAFLASPAIGGVGWGHIGQLTIEYSAIDSTASILPIAVDSSQGSYYSGDAIMLPSTGGKITKLKLNPAPNKGKLFQFEFAWTDPTFELYLEGCEAHFNSWEAKEYKPMPIFGGVISGGYGGQE